MKILASLLYVHKIYAVQPHSKNLYMDSNDYTTYVLWKKKKINKSFIPIGSVVVLLFYVHGKHLRSFRDSQLT